MNRKRNTLLGAAALLVCTSLLGVFALISDTADTGTLSVETASQAASIDLKIHNTVITAGTTDCSALGAANYVDNQTTAPLTIANANPGTTLTRFICVRNAGSQPAVMTASLINTLDEETGCTGDESDTDLTCGTGAGEVADDVDVTLVPRGVGTAGQCDQTTGGSQVLTFDGVADTGPQSVSNAIPGGQYACYRVIATYDAATPAAEVQDNQTDKVSWQFRFHGAIS